MRDRVRWINHKGVRILNVDYSGLDGPGIQVIVAAAIEAIEGEPTRDVRSINNFTDSFLTGNVMEIFRAAISKIVNNQAKTAVYGLSSGQLLLIRMLAESTKHPIQLFPTRDAALDFLITD